MSWTQHSKKKKNVWQKQNCPFTVQGLDKIDLEIASEKGNVLPKGDS